MSTSSAPLPSTTTATVRMGTNGDGDDGNSANKKGRAKATMGELNVDGGNGENKTNGDCNDGNSESLPTVDEGRSSGGRGVGGRQFAGRERERH